MPISEGNVNVHDQDFQRQLALVQEEKAEDHKRWSQQACQHRLHLQLLVLLLLLCFVLGVLSQHYFPMDVSTDIFPPRSFQVDVSGVHGTQIQLNPTGDSQLTLLSTLYTGEYT